MARAAERNAVNNILKSTEAYEAWLAERLTLIPSDLDLKHEEMAQGVFPFLRATFYRWTETFPQVCKKLQRAPAVTGVGDLHVENFGTWRDIEGRLVWGINDFDEVATMPYTCDLVRLATSAHLAIAADHLKIASAQASQAILDGYRDGLKSGGMALVLGEHHSALREMAVARLKEPEKYWAKLNGLPTLHEKVPDSARKALERMLPERRIKYRTAHRVAGLGSLGRRRYIALAEWRGSSLAREAKELTGSAWLWQAEKADPNIRYQLALNCAIRCPDPFVRLRGRWIVRRLAPDCSRIELSSLPAQHDAVRLLKAMGWETANIHLGSRDSAGLLRHLTARPKNWLHSAALAMVDSVRSDWEDWKKLR